VVSLQRVASHLAVLVLCIICRKIYVGRFYGEAMTNVL